MRAAGAFAAPSAFGALRRTSSPARLPARISKGTADGRAARFAGQHTSCLKDTTRNFVSSRFFLPAGAKWVPLFGSAESRRI
jgi:hypothetical protein